MFTRKFLYSLSFLLVFSTIAPSYSMAISSTQNRNEEIVDLTQSEQLTDQEVIELSDDIQVVENSNTNVSELTVNIDSDDLKVESALTTDLETGKMEYVGEIQEGDESITLDFEVFLSYVDGDDFGGFIVDNNTGEKYSFDTKVADASAVPVPLIVIAVQIVRYGVQWAIKKHGKTVVNNALKSSAHTAAKKIKSSLLDDNGVKIKLFTQKIKGKQEYKDPKSGWSISRDVGKNNSHGGSYWKLIDKYGKRIATLDKNGKVLRE